MKYDQLTRALVAAGVVSLAAVASAEERPLSQVLTAVSSTTLSGYVDTSAIWKFGTGNAYLPGRAYDGVGKLDGFNFNVAGVTLEKPLSDEVWSAGYRVDLLFGPDANSYNTSPFGTDTVDGTSNTSDFSVQQAYVALRVPIGNGLDFTMGAFNSPIGYETFASYLNPNYSRSFGWQLEPTQQTGLLASYLLADGVKVIGGVANTWRAGINTRSDMESQKSWIGAVALTAPDSWGWLAGSSLSAGVINGFSGNQDASGNFRNTVSYYVGASLMTPVEGLAVGAAFDYRENGLSINNLTPGENWAYAAAGYLSFQATEKLKLVGRADYTKGSDGTFYDGGLAGISDSQNELFALTVTADYALWANVISRLEFRWDNAMGDVIYGGTTAPSDENALTLAGNVIFKF
jgi:hypothetical protein